MNKALSFVHLDFVTIKPYFSLKNLAIIIIAPLFLLISTGASTMGVGMFVIFSAMYISYPFVICEKNNMDTLYPTLSLNRKTIVLGRYLFALSFNLCALLMGIVVTFTTLFIMRRPINTAELLLTAFAMLAITTIIEAVQFPIYFKLGYEKAKLLAYMPFIGFWLGALGINSLISKIGGLPENVSGFLGWLAANPNLAVLSGAVIWLGLMLVSLQISLSFYNKRDF